MRFGHDDIPVKKHELEEALESDDRHMLMAAEQRIKAMHSHNDGTPVELHEIGSKEFIKQSIGDSLEGKIGTGSFGSEEKTSSLLQQNTGVIEYEKKSSQNQPHQSYGAQQSVTGGSMHKQETAMMGCNCGAEWTVTGQSTKQADSGPGAVKIERYGSTGSGSAGYNITSGSGGGPGEYRAGGGQSSEYRG